MSPAALTTLREAHALATLTPGEAVKADRYDEYLAALKAGPAREAALLQHVRELECKLAFVERSAADRLEMARKIAAERNALQALLDTDADRVESVRFRAAQARIRNQRRELERLQREISATVTPPKETTCL